MEATVGGEGPHLLREFNTEHPRIRIRHLGWSQAGAEGRICETAVHMKGALAAVLLAGARATYLYESMCSTDDGVCFSIKDKAQYSMQLAEAIQTKFEAYQNSGSSATCTAFDTCNYGDSLEGMTSACDANYGATEGCDCEGRGISTESFVVKATTAVTPDATDIMNAVCYTQGLETTFKSIAAIRRTISSGCTTARWRACS